MLGGGIFAYLGLLLPEKSAENAGRFDDDSELRRSFLRNNLYFEMSHAEPWGKQQLECAIKALGSEHVIFGSSYPVKKKWLLNGPDFVKQLDISNEDKENVLYKNAMKLYME